MSYKSLRRLAIKQFKNSEFNVAKSLFSLAYEQNPSDELLYFIELCVFGEQAPGEVAELFGAYFSGSQNDQTSNLAEMLRILQSEFDEFNQKAQSQNAISYGDFKAIADAQGGFKRVFESVMHSTKIIITNKDDLVDFIGDLVENGYDDIGMNYLENLSEFVKGDEKLLKIARKFKRNENKA